MTKPKLTTWLNKEKWEKISQQLEQDGNFTSIQYSIGNPRQTNQVKDAWWKAEGSEEEEQSAFKLKERNCF